LPVIKKNKLVGQVTRNDIRVYLALKTDILNQESSTRQKV